MTASQTRQGLAFVILAAVCFGTSGTLATGLLDAGWSAASVVIGRVLIGGAVLAPLAIVSLRGRWTLLRREWRLIAVYGAVVVAFTQFSYFNAVNHLDVAVALLIEYVSPVAVLLWLWARHGERPTWVTSAGAVTAVGGLLLVLDVFSGADIDGVGVLWGIAALVGCAVYFLLSGQPTELPPAALASLGLLIGGAGLAATGVIGLVELRTSTAPAEFVGATLPFWVPLVLIGVVSSAMAYWFGIIGTRLIGSRVGAFVSLLEVLAAVVFSWIFLGQHPGLMQLIGGLSILTGIVLVKLGERPATVALLDEAEVPALG